MPLTFEPSVVESLQLDGSSRMAVDEMEKAFEYLQQLSAEVRTVSGSSEIIRSAHEITESGGDLGPIAIDLIRLKHELDHLVSIQCFKVTQIGIGFVQAINEANVLVAALCARSIHEHAAILSYLVHETANGIAKLERQKEGPKISLELKRFRKKLSKVFYGSTIKQTNRPPERVLHINTLRKRLALDIPGEIRDYSLLCEYVHPNYGSNLLLTKGELGEGILGSNEAIQLAVMKFLMLATTTKSKYVERGIQNLFVDGVKIMQFASIALDPATKVETLFVARKLKVLGDGKSAKSAFHFPNARNHHEHIEMQHRTLQKNGLRPGRKELRSEGGHWYDLHHTSKGNVWFRIPPDIFGDETGSE